MAKSKSFFHTSYIFHLFIFLCVFLYIYLYLLSFSPSLFKPSVSTSSFFWTFQVGTQVELTKEKEESSEDLFWKQPDDLGYKPCLIFSKKYQDSTAEIMKNRHKRFLMTVVSGGLNQQRNQIVDSVVIARVLGASLVVPIFQVHQIWQDKSEFPDIFDFEHFKKVLQDDVNIVASLPSTHLMHRPKEVVKIPSDISSLKPYFENNVVLLLRGLEAVVPKDLPPDLQKLRCKVAFHALRFTPPILQLGDRLAERMKRKGPYIALHLRMEKDVWMHTGCLPGISKEYDEIIINERKSDSAYITTTRYNLPAYKRKLVGHCPLNAVEVMRLLKALGAPRNANIYWAGGEPFGGKDALAPLTREFPNFYNKEDLALPGELEPYRNQSSIMAAFDYIVSEKSDVFMPSHGGNMGRAIQGRRAYDRHKKFITPNKKAMIPYFMNSSISEEEFNAAMLRIHKRSLGQPDIKKISLPNMDVTKYPIRACMCKT